MDKWLNQVPALWGEYWPKLAGAAVILVVGWVVTSLMSRAVARALRAAKVDEGLTGFLQSLVRMLGLAVVFIAALGKLGVETTSFAAIIGAAGLAIGFALQGSLANFAAGVMILFFRPFKVGDYVEVAGTAGVIEAVAIFATTLKTPDNKMVIVPNASITNGNITNYSANDQRRVDMVFGVGYNDDLLHAKRVLTEIVLTNSKVLAEPAPTIAVSELADSSVNFVVRPWVKTADYWDALFEITEAVKLKLDAEGISIPYPQSEVHMHQVTPSAQLAAAS